jgi:tRNA A-37 threonylcarbamoyl transferase component Bud32
MALPGDAPEGLCPRCLMLHGLSTAAAPSALAQQPSAERYGGHFVPPEPAELARYFPHLEILELLGQGGMGAVYKARQPGLDRLVALKILPHEASQDAAFTERFTREARALARLNHPNIVSVYDFGQIGGLYYFLMEYVEGVNLRQLLRAGQLQPQQALQIAPQICEALQYAHDEGIVHRDIKPENILLDKKGRIKIADFGLAKLLGRATAAEAKLTGPYQVMGTLHYMAPEQVDNPTEVDHRADIYSLGVVFYEMLTGKLPLGRFAPPSQTVKVDVRLDEVVLKTLEREPERRYQHASEVKTLVETIGGQRIPGYLLGYEYRSKRTFLGVPLVHMVSGIDPNTGRQRVARGIIAIGGRAVGVVAVGGAAFGGITMGGVSVGVISFGGTAIGLVSIGGLAIGLLAALGGWAIGGIALGGGAIALVASGGGAVGYYAMGGGAWGVHALGDNVRDPLAQAFFEGGGSLWSRFMGAMQEDSFANLVLLNLLVALAYLLLLVRKVRLKT